MGLCAPNQEPVVPPPCQPPPPTAGTRRAAGQRHPPAAHNMVGLEGGGRGEMGAVPSGSGSQQVPAWARL